MILFKKKKKTSVSWAAGAPPPSRKAEAALLSGVPRGPKGFPQGFPVTGNGRAVVIPDCTLDASTIIRVAIGVGAGG